MNSANSFAFFIFGNLMHVLPSWMYQNASSAGPSEASVIWLHVMGAVIGLIGTSYLARQSAVFAVSWARAVRNARVAVRPAPAPVSASLPSGARVLT